LPENAPKIRLGAEVSYDSGISRLEGLNKLCIEGTQLLLLEMPFEKWTDHTLSEVRQLAMLGRLTVILAHIERYLDMQGEKIFEELQKYGVIMQVNSSFFNRVQTKRKALKLLANGRIHLIGSDTHNVALRPPTLDTAYNIIEKKFGKELIHEINGYGHFLLG
jgi:protein-tyrosine phosphatase